MPSAQVLTILELIAVASLKIVNELANLSNFSLVSFWIWMISLIISVFLWIASELASDLFLSSSPNISKPSCNSFWTSSFDFWTDESIIFWISLSSLSSFLFIKNWAKEKVPAKDPNRATITVIIAWSKVIISPL